MRRIKKVAVLGSGIMGSRIACHFANIGVQVLLLDIVPNELTEAEIKKGLTLESQTVRNRIVNNALTTALKSNPSPVYDKSVASRIETGNLTDDLFKIADYDWILEAVIENLKIKNLVFDEVEKFRKQGTIVSTNTSGIPIHQIAESRSDDFKKHFIGTHFFNPPRYLRLLEIIPTANTKQELIDFLMEYGDLYLGKSTVLCKDTPAFIANRIGVFSIMSLFHLVEEMKLTVEEVDKLTGPVLGRPKSATFRTCDVVGLDTLVKVAKGVYENCPNDEKRELFKLPDYITKMVENNMLGAKTKKGFYQKVTDEKGKSEIQALDLNTLKYSATKKTSFATLELTKQIENIKDRMKVLLAGKDSAGEFYRKSFYNLFSYVSFRIPEIADELYKVDAAMEAGFGWELPVFEAWDSLGVTETVSEMKKKGFSIAPWVTEMLNSNNHSFYNIENGIKQYYSIPDKKYQNIPGTEKYIVLDNLRSKNTVWTNGGCNIIDLGEGILNVEFKSKMNTIGSEIIQGVHKAIDLAESEYRGVVISNNGPNFSVGANLGMVFMLAIEQEYDEIDMAVRMFQNVNMRIRYSSIPIIVAPHNMTLGGGCEMSMHSDKIIASAETYIGLVEFGVGLIPGGGGTKEFALRLSDEYSEGDMILNDLKNKFLTIGMAKVSTSAEEAFELGYFRKGIDEITINSKRLIAEAKQVAIDLAEDGYSQKSPRKDIKVLGKQGLGMVYAGANSMKAGKYISDHDQLISKKLGYILCGGDLSSPTDVSEQYLLDLEREAFLSLCGERKTLERIQHMLKTGKPLRN